MKGTTAKNCIFKILLVALLLVTPAKAEETKKSNSAVPASIEEQVQQQQQRIAELERLVQQQAALLERLQQQLAAQQGEPVAASRTATAVAAPQTSSGSEAERKSPLSFRIGTADFTPGGFMDLTQVFRTTNVGSGIGTSFGGIPYNNTLPAAGLTESRFSAQNSRVSLKVDTKVATAKVTGYLETDFLGNAPTNLFVTSNANTLRMRLYWADVRLGKWEFLGGQSWSMMTPNRKGISPMPGDIFYSQDMDTNYQVGLVWSRDPQFRVVYHANDFWTMGFSLESAQQFTGGVVTFPTGVNTSQQIDTGSNTATPNVHPDLIAKVAFDHKIAHRDFHIEFAGLYRTFKINTFTAATSHSPVVNADDTVGGGGGSINTAFELFKNFRLIETAFWSDGGGRYIFGLAPDFIIRPPNAQGIYTASPVHAGSGIGGFEWQAVPNTMLYGYYGGAYFGKNFVTVAPGTFCGASGRCGYGYPGSANSQNRSIQEGTLGLIQTLWKNPNYGALQIITQVSYLTRNPWSVASGTPKNAHLVMGYVDLRYVLP